MTNKDEWKPRVYTVSRWWNFGQRYLESVADESEHATPILCCHGIFADWSIFSIAFLFWKEDSSGPVTRWRQLVSCHWSWHSHESLKSSYSLAPAWINCVSRVNFRARFLGLLLMFAHLSTVYIQFFHKINQKHQFNERGHKMTYLVAHTQQQVTQFLEIQLTNSSRQRL